MEKTKNPLAINLPSGIAEKIAKKLGISEKTVSRVVNGHRQDASKDTFIKVYNVAKTLMQKTAENEIQKIDKAILFLEEVA